ncbi:MAG: ABC transporter ATP-binding protein [Sorangiineae bacterium]|nr:ABC transporter ATP-binding protein [Polyangiaceae bacterium]MEB2322955.1 ABC transporter ATP-binding protein [Sorangiineae bacterium]
MSILVRTENVTKVYGKGALATPVLHGITMEMRAGELVLLMGPSGSGKTTLISILAGLLRATTGEVELCGKRISGLAEREVTRVRRDHLGFIFQTYNLFPALTALDNVAEVLRLKGEPIGAARDRASRALERVGLGDRMHHRPSELSGGQKQRVAIARALAGEPSLVLGDEVTAALDTSTAMSVMELLREQVAQERGILIVTHDRRLEQYADRVIHIEDGRIQTEIAA